MIVTQSGFGLSRHVQQRQHKNHPMISKYFKIQNAEKAAKFDSRTTGTICVRFPFNDYWRGKNRRVFTGEPVESRIPRFREGKVFVSYDNRSFEVQPHARLILKGYKARIFWRTVSSSERVTVGGAA